MGAAMWGCVRFGLLLALAGLVLVSSAETGASVGITERVSLSSAGAEGNGPSESPAISADGRYVAFDSLASNLVTDDSNGVKDVFVRDHQTWVTDLVSVSTGGVQGTSDSLSPAISSDGRYVAFQSFANDLVLGDTVLCGTTLFTYSCPDIFVRDRQTSTTELVSLSSAEVQADSESWSPAINDDGRFVAFYSDATNLVSGDTNDVEDVFVRDRQAGTTVRVSVSSGGTQANGASDGWIAISSTGRYVAFTSDASNLVTGDTNDTGDVFVRDRDTDADGIFDEAGAVSTTRVSVSSGGAQGNGESYYAAISGDGRYVAFGSAATNLVTGDTNGFPDVFVRDRQTATTARVSLHSAGTQGNAGSFDPAISADGRQVAFQSFATNLADGDTNVFCDTDGDDEYDDNCPDVLVRDRDTDEDGILDEAGAVSTIRVSVSSLGGEGDGESLDPAISGDGNRVAFYSYASNLVAGDTNTFCDTDGDTAAGENCQDVFLRNPVVAVGGVAQLPDVASGPGRAETNFALLAGLAAAAAALALIAGARYAGRRFRQG
jgi:hypothetical protein